jgi:hypothetical protein
MRRAPLLLALVCLTLGCASPSAPDVPPGAISVVGTVHYYTIEGGFWAVRGNDRVTYDPMDGLPSAFQVEGLQVRMIVKVRDDLGGVHMAGPIVEIIRIERR